MTMIQMNHESCMLCLRRFPSVSAVVSGLTDSSTAKRVVPFLVLISMGSISVSKICASWAACTSIDQLEHIDRPSCKKLNKSSKCRQPFGAMQHLSQSNMGRNDGRSLCTNSRFIACRVRISTYNPACVALRSKSVTHFIPKIVHFS